MPKPLSFRPQETAEKIINDTMNSKGFATQSEAINYLIESSLNLSTSMTERAETSMLSPPMDSTKPVILPKRVSSTPLVENSLAPLPQTIEKELQHFLNGRDSPLIQLYLSDSLRLHPEKVLAATMLRD